MRSMKSQYDSMLGRASRWKAHVRSQKMRWVERYGYTSCIAVFATESLVIIALADRPSEQLAARLRQTESRQGVEVNPDRGNERMSTCPQLRCREPRRKYVGQTHEQAHPKLQAGLQGMPSVNCQCTCVAAVGDNRYLPLSDTSYVQGGEFLILPYLPNKHRHRKPMGRADRVASRRGKCGRCPAIFSRTHKAERSMSFDSMGRRSSKTARSTVYSHFRSNFLACMWKLES